MIIGLTGTCHSGKNTITDFLVAKGFKHYSVRSMLEKEVEKRGKNPKDRSELQIVANELREKHGNGFLMQAILEDMKEKGYTNVVIESIRNPGEVEALKNPGDFCLLALDADKHLRYVRGIESGHILPTQSYKDFVEQENRELTSKSPHSQKLNDTIAMADYLLLNNGSKDELYARVSEILVDLSNMSVGRITKDQYYLELAKVVASRGTCKRRNWGAIIVKDDQIISAGYVGSPRGTPNCIELPDCQRKLQNIPSGTRYEDCRSVHAEQNAIINAARAGVSVLGGRMYMVGVNYLDKQICPGGVPCKICRKMIINAGIKEVVIYDNNLNVKRLHVESWVKNDDGTIKDESINSYE